MRRLLIIVAIPLLLLVGWYGYQRILLLRAQQPAVTYETMPVTRGNIASTVSASGSIESTGKASLAFRAPSLISAVHVEPGQAVVKGQVLAELDTTDLVLALAQTQANLEITKAQLAKAERPISDSDLTTAQAAIDIANANIAGAQAALASAQASHDQLMAGPTEAERTVNSARTMEAEAQVKRAQQAYDVVKDLPNVGMLPQSLELERATLALEVARAQAALLDLPPDAATIAAADNQIAQAQMAVHQAEAALIEAESNLAALQAGPLEEDLDILRVQVRQGEIGILQAEYNIQRAQLIAPLDGVVTAVNISEGQYSNTAVPDIVIADPALDMKVLIDEIDISDIQVGQPVQLRIDALPESNITGTLTSIAESASVVGGVMAYEGVISLDETTEPLRAGMSATANITTAQLDDVLYVENRFIQLDRNTGQASVYKMVNGKPVLQEVTLGVRGEQVTEVISGLEAGDEVAFVTQSSQEQLRNTLFGSN